MKDQCLLGGAGEHRLGRFPSLRRLGRVHPGASLVKRRRRSDAGVARRLDQRQAGGMRGVDGGDACRIRLWRGFAGTRDQGLGAEAAALSRELPQSLRAVDAGRDDRSAATKLVFRLFVGLHAERGAQPIKGAAGDLFVVDGLLQLLRRLLDATIGVCAPCGFLVFGLQPPLERLGGFDRWQRGQLRK
jgi:hypothetical protein